MKSPKISLPQDAIPFRKLSPQEVLDKFSKFLKQLHDQSSNGIIPTFEIPSQSRENVIYDERGRIFLGEKLHSISLDQHNGQLIQVLRLIEIITHHLIRGINLTKRSIFYLDMTPYQSQRNSDRAIRDLLFLFQTYRSSLGIFASPKGVVRGLLEFDERGDHVYCKNKVKQISSNINDYSNIQTDAEFILLIDKDSIFNRLTEDEFHLKYPSILITAKGHPDIGTRLFLRYLQDELELPIYSIMDADPGGYQVLSDFSHGSISHANYTTRTAVDIFHLGLRLTDFDEYNLDHKVMLPLSQPEQKMLSQMIDAQNFRINPILKQDLQNMMDQGVKAEAQSINIKNPHTISNDYLPAKIQSNDYFLV